MTNAPSISSLRQALRGLKGQTFVTRFAPSPTGYLHLGHVASALFVWGVGRALNARIILRMEDHDQGRSRKVYEEAILKDLAWLGFEADDGVRNETPSPYRQSDHWSRYDEALTQLRASGHVYHCRCSRREIEATQPEGTAREELYYPNTCRELALPDAPKHSIRLAMPPDSVTFDDLWLGQETQTPLTQCGDLQLRDRDGYNTYQFAVTVDDWREGVNLVIRGQDLTASTGRQILLAGMLGRTEPARFLHHPLLVDETGRKLSKRSLAEAIGRRREMGESAADILGEAAHLTGLLPEKRPFHAPKLKELFL